VSAPNRDGGVSSRGGNAPSTASSPANAEQEHRPSAAGSALQAAGLLFLPLAMLWPDSTRRYERQMRRRERRLSRTSQRVLDNLTAEFNLDEPKLNRKIDPRDVGLLNALRTIYLLGVASGAIRPGEMDYRPDVREINETRDVLEDDTERPRAKPPATKIGDPLILRDYLAAMIVLSGARNMRPTTDK
jgi:hypothetical protein